MRNPNVIIILLDDYGWKDAACFGSTFYETPNIDRLAARSMQFTNGYATCPVCSPSRASLLTGRYPARLGITHWIGAHDEGKLAEVEYLHHLPTDVGNIAKSFGANGYHTWHVGKWHLGDTGSLPEDHGFEVNVAGCEYGMPPEGYFAPFGLPNLEDGDGNDYLTDRLTDEATALIANATNPFFLYMSHYAVHTPIQAKAEDIAYFVQKARHLGLDTQKTFEEGEAFPCRHKSHLRIRRRLVQSDPVYAAMIWNLDQNIGRLLEAVEAAGQTEDTIVMFTSDNGGLSTAEGSPTCNLPLIEGKGWMYEGGVREPFLFSWPGHIEPGFCDVPVTGTDIYPTCLALAGLPLEPQHHVDGVDLSPLLYGDSLDRGPLYWHFPHYGNQGGKPGASIRLGNYKLIYHFEDQYYELFDLMTDPSETTDLSKLHPRKVDEMAMMLSAWQQEVGAKFPVPNRERKQA